MPEVKKAPSGIRGLDELTGGGLPAGRPTLVCGGPGCGKTLLATTFLVKGARDHAEPGVFVSFDERIVDLAANVSSLGFDLLELQERSLIAMDHVVLDRQAFQEAGEYDLEGLFVRLGYAIDRVKAKRVVLDSIDSPLCRHSRHCGCARGTRASFQLAERTWSFNCGHRRARRDRSDAEWS